jgi:hypothetical protein
LLAFELAGKDAGQVLGAALAIKMVTYIGIAPLVGRSRTCSFVIDDIHTHWPKPT